VLDWNILVIHGIEGVVTFVYMLTGVFVEDLA